MMIEVDRINTYSDLPSRGADGSDLVFSTEEALQASHAHIAALQMQLSEMRDRWMRAEAETANVRMRARKDARQFAIQKFATDAVEAAENLRRGLDSVPVAFKAEHGIVAQLRDGFAGVERSFVALLERNGVKGADPTGSPFDPDSQQAVAAQETSVHPPGTVMRALTSTWTLNGRLLRPAMVVVAKPPGNPVRPSNDANAGGFQGRRSPEGTPS